MNEAIKSAENDTGLFIEELRGLSRNATRFLRQHPKEARMVVAAALEAAAVQYELEPDASHADVPERLKPFVVHRPSGADMTGVSDAAARLEVSRTTIYDWVEKKTLLGWKSTKRGLTIPVAQILGPGRVVPGIFEVLEIIGDPELAWAFLSQEWPFADHVARPIDRLKAGDVKGVVDAAPGFGTDFM